MMKILLIIIVFVCSILNGWDLGNERNIDLLEENVGDEVVVQTIDDASENLKEETNDETGIEEKVEQVHEVVTQEPTAKVDNTQQYQEQVNVPEEIIVQEQTVQETIQDNQEEQKAQETTQQEESGFIVDQFEENLPMEIPERTDEYRYNADMTKKMIDMINNNQNENMKQYGYNVVVDSSAKENSNPFTYTDERMLTKIQRRWGTIHVYAEDYYLNGNYFGTDCYIY